MASIAGANIQDSYKALRESRNRLDETSTESMTAQKNKQEKINILRQLFGEINALFRIERKDVPAENLCITEAITIFFEICKHEYCTPDIQQEWLKLDILPEFLCVLAIRGKTKTIKRKALKHDHMNAHATLHALMVCGGDVKTLNAIQEYSKYHAVSDAVEFVRNNTTADQQLIKLTDVSKKLKDKNTLDKNTLDGLNVLVNAIAQYARNDEVRKAAVRTGQLFADVLFAFLAPDKDISQDLLQLLIKTTENPEIIRRALIHPKSDGKFINAIVENQPSKEVCFAILNSDLIIDVKKKIIENMTDAEITEYMAQTNPNQNALHSIVNNASPEMALLACENKSVDAKKATFMYMLRQDMQDIDLDEKKKRFEALKSIFSAKESPEAAEAVELIDNILVNLKEDTNLLKILEQAYNAELCAYQAAQMQPSVMPHNATPNPTPA